MNENNRADSATNRPESFDGLAEAVIDLAALATIACMVMIIVNLWRFA